MSKEDLYQKSIKFDSFCIYCRSFIALVKYSKLITLYNFMLDMFKYFS